MTVQNSRREYAFVAESVFGVTPASPQTQLFEVVSFDAELQSQQLSSNTINSHRQTTFSRRGNKSTAGNISVEMVADNFDFALEALLGGTWSTNVLKVGNTQRSFAVEERFMDAGLYRVFNGLTFNELSMSITPENLITAQFGVMGSGATDITGTSIDSSPTAVSPKPVFFHEEGTIAIDGSAVAIVTGINLKFTNNDVGNRVITNAEYHSISTGRVQVTGDVTALFTDATLYDKFYQNTAATLEFSLSAGSPAETLTFSMSNVKFTAGELTRGDTGPVLVKLSFQADYDSTDASSLVITRSA